MLVVDTEPVMDHMTAIVTLNGSDLSAVSQPLPRVLVFELITQLSVAVITVIALDPIRVFASLTGMEPQIVV